MFCGTYTLRIFARLRDDVNYFKNGTYKKAFFLLHFVFYFEADDPKLLQSRKNTLLSIKEISVWQNKFSNLF